ncbi:membrane protein implicated in regulation of membrane protease activity [Sphingobium sp. B1D7B]|uniref:YqiJ family protein n=1 Tax=unclassified Sphingobium TaxID=2611147 RepID=UPI0022256459|nr:MULTISPECIES: YqiJ family protein [unclassified Sphingobium]MCW2392874.1 membrane protein implicated in regulation of membrane protease activity [Sphingobium sp. B11D3A]MCW2404676.1 membrane protein implicated in regulation of membrane protease activity [Sphingobium sp. B1D7B]
MSLLADYNWPFAVSLGVMVLLAALQVLGLGDLFSSTETDLDAESGGSPADGLLSLVGVGRVPFMIWLAVLLLLFAAIGVSIQSLAGAFIGKALAPWLAGLLASVVALPATGALVRPLSRILPGDETTAVEIESLLGRRAKILTGRASRGSPTRAQVIDHHGQMHLVMVEPHHSDTEMGEGDEVLLVRREGERFYAVALEEKRLAPI